MRLVGYKLRLVIIIVVLTIVFITYAMWRISCNHTEAARWVPLNDSIYLGETKLIISQVALINFNPAIQGRLTGCLPHLLEFAPSLRDTLDRLLYYLKPSPVTPGQSEITISVQILFRPEDGRPNLAFILNKKQSNSPSYPEWGEGVVFENISFTGVDWNQNDFLLTIRDRTTGKEQSMHIQPVGWKLKKYHFGDPAAPFPPGGVPMDTIITGFLVDFQIDFLYRGGEYQEWKNYLIPGVRETFPSNRMRVWRNGEQLVPDMIGVCSWEGSLFGFDCVYAYTLAYFDSQARDSMLRQKLYFVRWQDSWRVVDVGPVQSLTYDQTKKPVPQGHL